VSADTYALAQVYAQVWAPYALPLAGQQWEAWYVLSPRSCPVYIPHGMAMHVWVHSYTLVAWHHGVREVGTERIDGLHFAVVHVRRWHDPSEVAAVAKRGLEIYQQYVVCDPCIHPGW
jgi:hypothetical protein